MICLDTNAISEIDRPLPDNNFVEWMRGQEVDALYLPGPVVMELAYGAELARLHSGTNKYALRLEILLSDRFAGRILDFAGSAPLACGRLRARRERMGRPISPVDAMIAAICIVNGAALATRNARDFDGLDLKVINPFEPA